jgi:hypothetical protein
LLKFHIPEIYLHKQQNWQSPPPDSQCSSSSNNK